MGRQRLLIIGHTWPEPKATAAGVRMMQLISFFDESNWNITFACTAVKSENSADLDSLEIEFQDIQVNDDHFDVILQELQPDVVLFDRFITEEQFGWRVAEVLPGAIRILDTEDLHSLRTAREQAVKAKRKFDIKEWLGLDQTKRELASIYRSDLSIIISRYEMKLLEEELGIPSSLLLYLPFWSDFDSKSALNYKDYSERKGFVFIGNGKHKPNVDAIHYLKEHIWPKIRKHIPEARIAIYGAYLPESIKVLHNPKLGFFVEGYVKDAHQAIGSARVNLVPLRYGAGLKGKLLLAFENGTPSVTTTTGIEGFTDFIADNEYAFDEPDDFAKEAVRLYSSQLAWEKKQAFGYKILESDFSSNHHKEILRSCLNDLSHHLEELRSSNIVGSMLQHHSMQSTKYLSKWITLKNQLKSQKQDT